MPATRAQVGSRPRPVAARPSLLRRAVPWVLIALGVVAAVALQTQLYSGEERSVTTIFMFVALAQAWNLIGGFAGYASFGQVVFFGIGGYTTAVLMAHEGLSFWPSLLFSGVFAAAFGAVIGLPLLRLRGHYFAIATLGVAEGSREVVTNMPGVTGGGAGITVPVVGPHASTAWLGNDGFYVLFLVLAVTAVVISTFVSRSKFGYALRAINQEEDAAASMGINTTATKVTVFALSGFIVGLIGAAYAFEQVTIYPQRLFDADISVLMVVMVVIGGSGTILGPVIGAVALQYLSEYLRHNSPEFHTFILGGIIIATVVLLPQGAVNYVREAVRERDFSLLRNIRRFRL